MSRRDRWAKYAAAAMRNNSLEGAAAIADKMLAIEEERFGKPRNPRSRVLVGGRKLGAKRGVSDEP